MPFFIGGVLVAGGVLRSALQLLDDVSRSVGWNGIAHAEADDVDATLSRLANLVADLNEQVWREAWSAARAFCTAGLRVRYFR